MLSVGCRALGGRSRRWVCLEHYYLPVSFKSHLQFILVLIFFLDLLLRSAVQYSLLISYTYTHKSLLLRQLEYYNFPPSRAFLHHHRHMLPTPLDFIQFTVNKTPTGTSFKLSARVDGFRIIMEDSVNVRHLQAKFRDAFPGDFIPVPRVG